MFSAVSPRVRSEALAAFVSNSLSRIFVEQIVFGDRDFVLVTVRVARLDVAHYKRLGLFKFRVLSPNSIYCTFRYHLALFTLLCRNAAFVEPAHMLIL